MKKELSISEVINTAMFLMAVIAFLMQILIDDSSVNIATACIALVSTLCTLTYIRKSNAIYTHPVSTFAIFGFCLTSVYGALLVQSITLESLSEYLRQPIETFSILLLFTVLTIAAHMTYRELSKKTISQQAAQQGVGLRRLLEKLELYTTPTVHQLWIMGLIGVISIFMSGRNSADENVVGKISDGISFIAWAPFLIPIYVAQIGRKYCSVKTNYTALVVFAAFFVLIGIASNARTIIVAGATTIGLFVLLIGMRNRKSASTGQILKGIVISVLFAAMLIPMSDLATAMVVVRETHKYASPVTKVYATIDALTNPQKLERYRNKAKLAAVFSPYDEYYIENPVLARFVLTKYYDNALYFESRLTERGRDELIDTTIDLLWSIFPDPVLKYFDLKIPKKSLRFTLGDYMYYQATGGALGGYKVGSSIAHGLGMFGAFFTLIYFVICILSYWVLDFLSNRTKTGEVVISAVGALAIWHVLVSGISHESLNASVAFLFREIPQSVLIFIVAYYSSKFVSYPFILMNQMGAVKGQPVLSK